MIATVRQSFIDHSEGKLSLPPPVQMLFKDTAADLRGDCHVKCAYSDDYPYFCVKIASGFYRNEAKAKPVNNGLVMLLSALSGEPLALFEDKGYLTSARTAAAGALAVELLAGPEPKVLGIVGTGHQAELQARWANDYTSLSKIVVWGRSSQKVESLCARLGDIATPIEVVDNVGDLCARADVILTTTPSTSPLVSANDIRSNQAIVAVGADSPGKTELDPAILAQADHIFTDDHEQCLHHGEFGTAVRAGSVRNDVDVSFGKALAAPEQFPSIIASVSVVDLTGLGAQDLAIASMVWEVLS
ncbi:MAG: ornithine cyclodeaminase family protein [Pseudomonadota bacterium]